MARDFPSIVFDSSALISLTDSCFVHALQMMRRKYSGKFVIPPSVEYECVVHPRKVRMHALHALRIARAIKDRVLEVVDVRETGRVKAILNHANSAFYVNGKPLELLQVGEAEALALAGELGCRDMVIDERTCRVLAEEPQKYAAHLAEEFGSKIKVDTKSLDSFLAMVSGMRFYRSTEFMVLAYEHGYFDDYGPMREEALEAALFRLKYAGCAISEEEIAETMRGQRR